MIIVVLLILIYSLISIIFLCGFCIEQYKEDKNFFGNSSVGESLRPSDYIVSFLVASIFWPITMIYVIVSNIMNYIGMKKKR